MTKNDAEPPTLADLGETGLLREIFSLLAPSEGVVLGPGDDAAVVSAPDRRFVVTTDVLVENVDFRRDWSSAQDVGWKAAMQNLADVAAMGASPTAVVVGLVAPDTTPAAWAIDLTRGLELGCRTFGAGVVGGDLSRGDAIVVSITAFGDLGGREPVTRSGAGVGDVVAIAGEPGWSGAGLALLVSGVQASGDTAVGTALARHRRPQPPVGLGVVANDAGASAMIDTSDGLLRDLGRIARASGVTVDLNLDAPAIRRSRDALAPVSRRLGQDWLGWLLSGGEDHCLVACFPQTSQLPAGFERIGEVVPRGARDVESDQADLAAMSVGYDHFRP